MADIHPWKSWLVVPTLGNRAGVRHSWWEATDWSFKVAVRTVVDEIEDAMEAFHRCRWRGGLGGFVRAMGREELFTNGQRIWSGDR